jgi:hypothetical protein
MQITGSKAPEGRDIGNMKRPLSIFSPRGAQYWWLFIKTLLLRPSGAKMDFKYCLLPIFSTSGAF